MDKSANESIVFTVIVPIYQDPRIFVLFIESLLSTVTQPTQIIFINDGSGAIVSKILRECSQKLFINITITVIENEHPTGSGKCINKALQLAIGKFIAILDSDLILLSDWQQQAVTTFSSNNRVGIVGGLLIYPQTGGIQHCGIAFTEDSARHLYLNGTPESIPLKAFTVQCVIFAFCIFKLSIYKEVGLLDEQYCHAYDDFDYQMRIRQTGYNIVVDPNIVAYHWERSNGINRTLNRKNNIARFWRKWGNILKPDLWDFVLSNITKIIRRNNSPVNVRAFDLCSVRGDANIFWQKINSLNTLIIVEEIIDYSHRNTDNQSIWLPMILDNDAFRTSKRLFFLVDNFCQLTENKYWFDLRTKIRDDDIIADLYGNVMLLNQISTHSWPGRKIR